LDEPVLLPSQRRGVNASPFPGLRPVVLTYALEEILAEKMRSILQRGKARDYYDVWRLLGQEDAAFDTALVRSILVQKCRGKGLGEPNVHAFLLPRQLAEAGVYWERDLAEQVAASSLPGWSVITAELTRLLENFLSSRPRPDLENNS